MPARIKKIIYNSTILVSMIISRIAVADLVPQDIAAITGVPGAAALVTIASSHHHTKDSIPEKYTLTISSIW
jgi:hypothetical protein